MTLEGKRWTPELAADYLAKHMDITGDLVLERRRAIILTLLEQVVHDALSDIHSDACAVIGDWKTDHPGRHASLLVLLDAVPGSEIRSLMDGGKYGMSGTNRDIMDDLLRPLLPEYRDPATYATSPAGRLAKLIERVEKHCSGWRYGADPSDQPEDLREALAEAKGEEVIRG